MNLVRTSTALKKKEKEKENYKKEPVRNKTNTNRHEEYLQGFNSRVDEAKNQINNLEYKEAKNTQSEEQKETEIHKNKDNVRSLQDKFKHINICIMEVPGEEREQ